jgi:putative spermidine/putrescine transport system substrate-binding protein
MTKAEIDLTIKTLIEAKKAGQFRALWKDFNESVNLMASGEVVIQSMWSPAVTAVRTKGIACNFQPLKEGYRAWAAGFGLPATLSGKKLDGAYEFINWFLDGWAGAYLNRQGYYSAVLDTAKAKMEAYEWAYWMEGKPAVAGHQEPERRRAGQGRRDCATAAATSSAWAASPAGTPSWTRTSTWCEVERVRRRLIL